MMTTTIHGPLGVYGLATLPEIDMLDLCDDFREALAELFQSKHNATIEARDRLFPDLFKAMKLYESIKAKIYETEKAIKAHHSDVRNRNTLTVEQADQLTELRDRRDAAKADIDQQKKPWIAFLRDYAARLKAGADWKKVKTLEKRCQLYGALKWPENMRDFAQAMLDIDIAIRELDASYQDAGLHWSTRAEIHDATVQKLKKDGPGVRYLYGRQPMLRPWTKLVIQIPGAATWTDIQGGDVAGLQARLIYTNHYATHHDESVYEMRQNLGTAKKPCWITYRLKLDRPFPDDAKIQRWALMSGPGKRRALPTIRTAETKPVGKSGAFAYDLRFRECDEGIEVCRFWGDNVNERLVLPHWLMEDRQRLETVQAITDTRANEFLAKRGINVGDGRRQGTDALGDYSGKAPLDTEAVHLLTNLLNRQDRARNRSARAARCIEKIYETAAARVCRCHAFVVHDEIDLRSIKRYDTRDLLKKDKLTPEVRRRMFACAVGKLREFIKRFGLPASADAVHHPPDGTRSTDLFTTWVRQLGMLTGTKPNTQNARSQGAVQVVDNDKVASSAAAQPGAAG